MYSPDSQTIASGSEDRTVRLWSASTGQPRATFTAPEWVSTIAYSLDGRTIASGSGAWNHTSRDHAVHLWDTTTGRLKADLTGHTSWVNSVRYSPDGTTLASASDDGTIRLWDASTGQHKTTLTGGTSAGMTTVVYSPDGSTIAAGSEDRAVRLWDTTTNTLKTILPHDSVVTSIMYAADGSTLAGISGSGAVRLWNTATGQMIVTLTGHKYIGRSVAFSPDGLTLASGSYDGTILLWDLFFVDNADAIVRFDPHIVDSPRAGKQLSFNIDIAGGKNITGYQATVQFDETSLRFISSENGDYLRKSCGCQRQWHRQYHRPNVGCWCIRGGCICTIGAYRSTGASHRRRGRTVADAGTGTKSDRRNIPTRTSGIGTTVSSIRPERDVTVSELSEPVQP